MDIYKITNKINNKIYVGKSKNGYEKRFIEHIKMAESSRNSSELLVIDRAIRKYGKENFICDKIDEKNSLSELNLCEKYWIKELNSRDPEIGYNIAPGGDGGDLWSNLSNDRKEEIYKRKRVYWENHPEEYQSWCNKNRINNLGVKFSVDRRNKIGVSIKTNYENNPDRRIKVAEFLSSTEMAAKRKEGLEKYWNNISEDRLIEMSNQGKKNWKDEDYRQKQSKTRATEEYKNKMRSKHPGKGYKNMYNPELDLCAKVSPDNTEKYLSNGYRFGTRPRSEETKIKCRISALNRKSRKDGD